MISKCLSSVPSVGNTTPNRMKSGKALAKMPSARVLLRKRIVISLLIIIVYVCYIHQNYYSSNSSTQIGNRPTRPKSTLIKNKILLYTKYYDLPWKDAFHGNVLFHDTRCNYTQNHDDLNSSEWVIFHQRDVINSHVLPKQKYPNQKWILYNIESPVGNIKWDNIEVFRNVSPYYDLTMNYRLDADIPIPYGTIKKNTNGTIVGARIDFKRKTKQIAWFVSNCESFSRREEIVKKLKQHIPIDIYGKCGTLACPRDLYKKNEKCYQNLSTEYKFYLSFENSLCIDYVTEKLFNILHYDIIPVVYGSANYSNILPPNSYIAVRNFSSSTELANYLNYVGNNETVYQSYFEWRNEYHVESDSPNTLCDSILNKDFTNRRGDIFKWWMDGTCEDTTKLVWTE